MTSVRPETRRWFAGAGEHATRSLPLVLVGAVVLAGALVDLPRRISVGPLTGLASLTILVFLLSLLVALTDLKVTLRESVLYWPLLLFVAWAALSLTWSPALRFGIQNVVIFATLGTVAISVSASVRARPDLSRAIETLLSAGSILLIVLYGISVILDGLDTDLILGPRTFALTALMFLAWNLSAWRHGSRYAGILAVLLFILITLSLSRTAMAAALLVVMPLALMDPRSLWRSARRVLLAWAATALTLFILIISFDALRERFETGDVRSFGLPFAGAVELNVTGRTTLWRLTWDSFREAPWIGQGAGSAQRAVNTEFPDLEHPLNDYLRVLHDYGVAGAFLMAVAMIALLRRAWRSWRSDPEAPAGAFHLGAILGIAAIAAPATTDNPLVYLFTMGPLAVLLGCSSAFAPSQPGPEHDAGRAGGSGEAVYDEPTAHAAHQPPPRAEREGA